MSATPKWSLPVAIVALPCDLLGAMARLTGVTPAHRAATPRGIA